MKAIAMRRLWAPLCAGACLGLAACSGPPPAAPLAQALTTWPDSWRHPGGGAPVSGAWWQGFGDATLTALVDEALRRNVDLQLAGARVEEVRALARAQAAQRLPALDLGLGAARSRSISDVTLHPYLSTGHQEIFQATYEVDLSGRIAAAIAAAQRGVDAAVDAAAAVRLSIAATVASGYIQLLSLDAQIALARMTLKARLESLRLTRARQLQGDASALETAQAEAEWRAAALQLPQLELAVRRQEEQLNVLLVRPPGPVPRDGQLDGLVPVGVPDLGLPSDLLRRRPDIAAAEQQVAASDAQLAVARAQLLPSLRLTASFGRAGASVLNGDPFTIWSLGGSILAPLFHGGQLHAMADASAARRTQTLLQYQRTVMEALAEVETQLSTHAAVREQLVQAQGQAAALEQALHAAGRRRAEGHASYLDELVAQRSLYAAQQSLLQYRAALLQSEVALFRALGGGWTADRATAPSPAAARSHRE